MKRDTRIDLRVTGEEKREIAERAARHGIRTAPFLRELGLTGRVQPIPSINALQWARLAGALSNLNQAVRLCNARIGDGAAALPDITPLILDVKAKVEEIRYDLKARRKGDA